MDRNTPHRDARLGGQPVATATIIYGGHMVAANATGYAIPASAGAAASTQTVLGVSDGWVDNTTGADGDALVIIRRGRAFLLVNSTADPITQAELGKNCYVVDSVTVAKTSDTDKRPYAGKVAGIEAGGVWVYF
ncbi:hypothetical protein NLN82_22340 [Citrobacter portucalensis]|uniref:hypothetical protein n=1 Tax=Citrobacter portucalensis TaxID=1639133 RepID=UPI00226B3D99|nr:hypothetical protein [Citrobacter portucalensis]MCX9038770.1 hypothetical protein [Citrobacter portucalensis]